MAYSLREQRILARWPHGQDAMRIRQYHQKHDMPTQYTDAAGNRVLAETDWYRITLTDDTSKPKRKAPLPPGIAARLAKLRSFSEQNRQRDIKRRLAAIRAFTPPNLVETLDDKIASQLRAQPERHRRTLSMLYSHWVTFNEQFFGGRLDLPILTIKQLENSQANCEIHANPCVINFNHADVLRHSTEGLCDTLLHEMVHQAIAQHDGPAAAFDKHHKGHDAEFARIANNIARQRGWPDCSEKITKGPYAAQYWPPRTHH